MYILKNAITSITRNKGRNILIGIIILVISCAVAVTLAINNSAGKLIESYKSKYDIEATIGINRENMMKDFNHENREKSKENMRSMFDEINNISIDDIKKYAESSYVKNFYYSVSLGVNAKDFEKADATSNNDMNNIERMPREKEKNNEVENGDFTLKGYSSFEAMNEFINGNYKIKEGEVFEDFNSNYCLINSELATLNNIKVKDKIQVVDTENEKNTYELVVSGIYEEKNEDENNKMNMFTNSVNTIITNVNEVKKITDKNKELKEKITPTFILTDSKVIENFQNEIIEKGLSENLKVETNLDLVESATSIISNVKTYANTFLVITLVIGTTVLLIINMINIRERKYEIGVLRTIGMKKSKVCLQFLSELLIVSLISIMLGAALGASMSVKVSNNMLESEIKSSQEQTNNIRDNFGKGGQMREHENFSKKFNGIANLEAFDSIDAVVDIKVLFELILIGLVITLISSLSAITSIQKFSPLDILRERS